MRTYAVFIAKWTMVFSFFTLSGQLARADCTLPLGSAGQVQFFTPDLKICDGTNWLTLVTVEYAPWKAAGGNVYREAGNVGIGTTDPIVTLDMLSRTDAIGLPAGTTAQRPSSPSNGMVRYNTTLNQIEAYVNGAWSSVLTTVNTPNPPAGTGGTGYFVLTQGTYAGNLGGLTGANTICRNELSANSWMGKPGTLDTNKVYAFLCDAGSCQSPQGQVNYFYAVAGEPAVGGSGFATNASGSGPGDDYALTAGDRFGASGSAFWVGRRNWPGNSAWWSTSAGGVDSCTGWTSNSSGVDGSRGDGATTGVYRFYGTNVACNIPLRLICFVNP